MPVKQSQSQSVVVHVHTQRKTKRRKAVKRLAKNSPSNGQMNQSGVNPASSLNGSFNIPSQHNGQFYSAPRIMLDPMYPTRPPPNIEDLMGSRFIRGADLDLTRPPPLHRLQIIDQPDTPARPMQLNAPPTPIHPVAPPHEPHGDDPYAFITQRRPRPQRSAAPSTPAPAREESVVHLTDRVTTPPLRSQFAATGQRYEGLDELDPANLTPHERALVNESTQRGRPRRDMEELDRMPVFREPMTLRNRTTGLGAPTHYV